MCNSRNQNKQRPACSANASKQNLTTKTSNENIKRSVLCRMQQHDLWKHQTIIIIAIVVCDKLIMHNDIAHLLNYPGN